MVATAGDLCSLRAEENIMLTLIFYKTVMYVSLNKGIIIIIIIIIIN
jgi:hypothetical protein